MGAALGLNCPLLTLHIDGFYVEVGALSYSYLMISVAEVNRQNNNKGTGGLYM